MDNKFIKRILIVVTFFLVVLSIASILIQFRNEDFDVLMSIYVVSTFSIAVLTIAYVITSQNQLEVMKEQLTESKKSRQLTSQPLPTILPEKFRIEPPRFFYSPPEDRYSIQSRYYANYSIENKGNYPAVNIDISSLLILPKEEDKKQTATANHISVLQDKSSYPTNDFMFVYDSKGDVIKSLLYDSVENFPLLVIFTHFKNMLGGCFRQSQVFRVMPKQNTDIEELKNWLALINSFELKYQTEIKKMKKLTPYKDEEWNNLFDFLKEEISKSVKENEQELIYIPLPGSYEVNYIEEVEYKKAIENIGYAVALPPTVEDCIAKEEEKENSDQQSI